MTIRLLASGSISAIALSILGASPAQADVASCQALRTLVLPGAHVTGADMVPAGTFAVPPGLQGTYGRTSDMSRVPAFCRVRGVATPTPQSEIVFEVWLPQGGEWSGRLHMVGNGGYSSDIRYAALGGLVSRGSVAVATNTGHVGDEPDFAEGRPESIADWGHRSVHASVVAAKAVTEAYFGRAANHSYFSGCSTGGHQGLMSAQRYPDDFDGILAGAPGHNRTNLNFGFLWQFVSNHRRGDNGNPILDSDDLRLVYSALMRACDGADGVEDGVIANPRRCDFDVAELLCDDASGQNCLTAEQVDALKAMYRGPRNPRTGEQLYPGWSFGTEGIERTANQGHVGWSEYWANPRRQNEPQRVQYFTHWVFKNHNWDWWSFDWDRDVDFTRRSMGHLVDAVSPDLTRFQANGGKLIMYMGWGDPVVAPEDTINYYEDVVDFTGRVIGATDDAQALAAVQDYARLFMVPGMGHCARGPGISAMVTEDGAAGDPGHDMVTALYDWVERSRPPAEFVVAKHNNDNPQDGVRFTRTLCAWPQTAQFRGGDPNQAANHRCMRPEN